ncbi:SMI1/KNR4 family protein [Nocardia pseudobrasiliensis]|uniref:Knr4/Smi1-like domain-containing protein n=1 Tax=Nocardia pseudobrasiliensis TaxID=45979 RepID=A0A370I2Z1_9NOCA|nr:SMI1/KNR4 family protein [Nocardia pseudobrasiliensis]RDI65109.1 hypothetical protein DFR76_107487 [Nocardia pseudobrasiliensis]
MGEPLGREAWQELVGCMVEQKRRLRIYDEYESDTAPNPGATEARLRAAEARLGRPLDPQYRELLSVADGWQDFHITYTLLGTDEIGRGLRWESGLANAEIWFDDPARYQLVIENDNGYLGTIFLDGGSVVSLPPDETYPDLYTYFLHELESMTVTADQAILGDYSEPWWGRSLRGDPPTIAEIVAKVVELTQIVEPTRPSPLRPGAAPAELSALDRDLGGALDPEHRELLAVSNGLSTPTWGLGDVLSSVEIRDGARWREALVQRQFEEDRSHRERLSSHRSCLLPDPEEPAPVLQRIGLIPAVPFAVTPVALYGVDVRDGRVRDLLRDPSIARPGDSRSSEGTVREHLLRGCWHLWWDLGHPAGPVD